MGGGNLDTCGTLLISTSKVYVYAVFVATLSAPPFMEVCLCRSLDTYPIAKWGFSRWEEPSDVDTGERVVVGYQLMSPTL